MNLFNLLYIDPAATSVLLSAITPIALALVAAVIIIWRKLKKKVQKTLNIDPNSNKEVEDDLVITDSETPLEEVAVAEVAVSENAETPAEDAVNTEETPVDKVE